MQLTNEELSTISDALWHASWELSSGINESKAAGDNVDLITAERVAIQALMTKIDRHLVINKAEA